MRGPQENPSRGARRREREEGGGGEATWERREPGQPPAQEERTGLRAGITSSLTLDWRSTGRRPVPIDAARGTRKAWPIQKTDQSVGDKLRVMDEQGGVWRAAACWGKTSGVLLGARPRRKDQPRPSSATHWGDPCALALVPWLQIPPLYGVKKGLPTPRRLSGHSGCSRGIWQPVWARQLKQQR